ncbi:hypothetical protein FE257_007855 [Aspergillus nanangensis]|uniref:Uncharacterized protein n=1 Tax=Aspergillus nanangensis TaxID=2582783 RepID=A0AAD4CXK0_ASPNN|nr:hypothetical protein FE257_007855 [Aspergillus nanangensis]
MPQFIPDPSSFDILRGKVIVITGGAQGIGAGLVTRLHQLGAKVIFGDISQPHSQSLLESLGNPPTVTAVEADLATYSGNYRLFRTAFDQYGHVDHALGNAALFEHPGPSSWIDPNLTIDTVGDEALAHPHNKILDLNVYGLCVFARMAAVFLRENRPAGEKDASITLFGSVCCIRDSPGAYIYQTSKLAILGLLRSMRKPVLETFGIRTNTICPGVTQSPMTKRVFHRIQARGLSTQKVDDVVDMTLGLMSDPTINGRSLYVERGTGWEFEEELDRSMQIWLGEEPTKLLRANAEYVNTGALLRDED